MKYCYVFVGLMCLFSLQGFGQAGLFNGHWYAGIDMGIFSNQTRMIAGELPKYTSGGSGTMPMYGIKIGRIINPYLSVETGAYSLPLNLVYLYQTNRAIGTNPVNFISFPLRASWRVRVFHDQLEAHLGGGLQYIWGGNQIIEKTFNGVITNRGHTWTDSLVYLGSINILRQHSINAEAAVSFNWAMSRRWTLSLYARQAMGLANLAKVRISIKNNQDPTENAEFVAKGSGFNTGIGVRYNFTSKKHF
ncbi:MAG: hypothetical protein R2822_26495 [Spirosomataceae bacterium]